MEAAVDEDETDDGPETGRWKAPAVGIVVGLVVTVAVALGAIVVDSVFLLIVAPPATGGIVAGTIARKGLVLGTLAGFVVGGIFGVAQLALIYDAVTSAEPTGGGGIALVFLLGLSMAYVGVATALGGLGGLLGGAVGGEL